MELNSTLGEKVASHNVVITQGVMKLQVGGGCFELSSEVFFIGGLGEGEPYNSLCFCYKLSREGLRFGVVCLFVHM